VPYVRRALAFQFDAEIARYVFPLGHIVAHS
jgi:hypothetical protein